MKFLMIGAAVLATLYIAFTVFIYVAQRSLLYFPPDIYLTPEAVNVPMTEIKNETGEIISWWAPPSSEDGKTVMVFHGNGSAIYSNHDIFRDLINTGHGVLSVGYPGYPGQGGETTKPNIVNSATAQYEWVRAQGIEAEDIAFYGTSLGSGVAAQLSIKNEPAILFVDAPFNSTLDMAQMRLPMLPVSKLMKDKFQSHIALKDKNIPLIWTHGTRDRVVPLSQGQKLFDDYSGPKTAHIIEGGDHINLWGLGGRKIVLDALSE
ncbi:MAG: alpha/beta hydrolase [Devosiaceae bacterium]